jgi:hypothetical protein
MKKINVLWNGKKLCQIYPHATRWEVIKYKMARFFRKVIITAFFIGSIYGAFNLGKYTTKSEVTYAKDVVEIKNDSFPAVLARICKAESGNRQFREDGRVLRGRTTPSDIGICQINETIWNDKARELGIDIYTEKGNKEMALWIFNNYGSDPWNASKKNWK